MLWEVPALKLTVIHPQHHFFEKINFLWFSIFELWVCGLWRQNFDLSGRISADWLYFREIYPYNSFSFKILTLIRISSFCSPNFPIFVDFLKTTTFTYTTRSSSGWVLMDLKVLPSKSSHSQLHFSYLWYVYISHRSKVTAPF